jgi:hypothetical protein
MPGRPRLRRGSEVALYLQADCEGEPVAIVRPNAHGDFEVSICVDSTSAAIAAKAFGISGSASACADPLYYLWTSGSDSSADSEPSGSFEAGAEDDSGGWTDDSMISVAA